MAFGVLGLDLIFRLPIIEKKKAAKWLEPEQCTTHGSGYGNTRTVRRDETGHPVALQDRNTHPERDVRRMPNLGGDGQPANKADEKNPRLSGSSEQDRVHKLHKPTSALLNNQEGRRERTRHVTPQNSLPNTSRIWTPPSIRSSGCKSKKWQKESELPFEAPRFPSGDFNPIRVRCN